MEFSSWPSSIDERGRAKSAMRRRCEATWAADAFSFSQNAHFRVNNLASLLMTDVSDSIFYLECNSERLDT
jgi:hypothetical protein